MLLAPIGLAGVQKSDPCLRAAANFSGLCAAVTSGRRSIHEVRNLCRTISNLATQVTKS